MDQRLPETAVTDWRGLCEELTEHLTLLDEPPHELVCRAQAALAQPEPEVVGPTPSEQLVEQWVAEVWHEGTPVRVAASDLHLAARAADWGARWGRPAPVPVAVSERLPGPEDCDEKGDCWFDTGTDVGWMLCDKVFGLRHGSRWWLPATALPLPQGEVE